MGLETATYISDLNASNPASNDDLEKGDDHIRLIKATLKATFPNINGVMTATEEELNGVNLPASYTPTRTVVSGGSSASVYSFVWVQKGDYVDFKAEFGMVGQSVGTPFVMDISKPYGGSFLLSSDIVGIAFPTNGTCGSVVPAPDTTSIRITVTPTASGARILVSATYLAR